MKHDFSPPLCTPRRAILSQNSLVSGPFPAPTATLTSHLYHGTVKCGVQRCDKRCLAASCRAATGLRKRRLCCDGLSVVYLRSSSLEYCASIARCVQYMYVSSWPSGQREGRISVRCRGLVASPLDVRAVLSHAVPQFLGSNPAPAVGSPPGCGFNHRCASPPGPNTTFHTALPMQGGRQPPTHDLQQTLSIHGTNRT